MSGDAAARDAVVLVTGLPRAGTSLAMQMLAAGGVPLLVDDARPPDASNPRGYLEYAPVRAIARDAAFVARARGRAVKVVAPLLRHLPAGERYVAIWMERDLGEVLASQAAMLARAARDPATPGDTEPEDAALRRAFASSAARGAAALDALGARVLRVDHAALLCDPTGVAARMASHLAREAGLALDARAAAAAVDPALWRERREALR